MADKGKETSNVAYLKGAKKKKKGDMSTPGNPVRPKSKPDLYITDDRFKRAMELVRNDMDRAFTLSKSANSQFYFLFKFLVKSGILNEKEYEKFLEEEFGKMNGNEKKE